MVMAKYKNQFRIQSNRLKEYDYSQPAWYYITICTKNKQHYFCEIQNSKMRLNHYGKIAHNSWISISNNFQNVAIDDFVIMPDHLHGIIIINEYAENIKHARRDMINSVSTNESNNHDFTDASNNKISQNESNNHSKAQKINQAWIMMKQPRIILGKIIRYFKASATHSLRKFDTSFSWQPNYYDHIIRNEKDLFRIRKYIKLNPIKWEFDDNNKISLNY